MHQEPERIEFTKKMKSDYTILVPSMLPIHFELIKNVFVHYGYHLVILKNSGRAVVDEGLKDVHNDTCYPALVVIGQMIDALKSGAYDVHKTALMITQTGGGCRASNYIHLLRKALQKAGLGYVPVISLNLSGLEKNSGFSLTLPLLRRALACLAYGDLMMLLDNQVKSYELHAGDSQALVDRWTREIMEQFSHGKGFNRSQMAKNLYDITQSFAQVPVDRTQKIRVGIVGEIFAKYSAVTNNNLEDFLHENDCEVMIPGLMSFMLFKIDNRLEDIKLYGGKWIKKQGVRILFNYLAGLEKIYIDTVRQFPAFVAPSSFEHVKELCRGVIGYGCKMGEGWLLTAEMLELIESGYSNIICVQPFGCLPNHVAGKGMIRKIRSMHEYANIVPIDCDPGATKVNQENRVKLMLAVARENLDAQEKRSPLRIPQKEAEKESVIVADTYPEALEEADQPV